MKLFEAITIRTRARQAAKALRDLLSEKTLPATLRKQVESLNQALGKTWKDLAADAEADAATDPEPREGADPKGQAGDQPLQEAANVGMWLEARLHTIFTELADDLFGNGYLTREERIALSHAIGQGLEAFTVTVEEEAGQLYQRARWTYPEDAATTMTAAGEAKKLDEPSKMDACVMKVMGQGKDKSSAFAICTAAMKEDKAPKDVDAKIWEIAYEIMRGKAEKTKEADLGEELYSDFTPLVEAAVRKDGTIPVKIIQPGWGASGYYPAEVLERDGPQVFKRGLQMFWDHATRTEEAERPEGSLRNLAGELVSDARWQADHPAGPGLYADAKVFEAFQPAVDELAPHIGVSIRAMGKAQPGQAEGKSGKIISAITAAQSCDYVTSPGAGGQILQLFEAQGRQSGALAAQTIPNVQDGKETPMDEKEAQALKEANAQLEKQLKELGEQLARLQEGALLREAGEFTAVELAKAELPQITKNRLLRDLAAKAPVKEGKLDREAFKALIAEAVKAETEYLTQLTGAGKISGMGPSTPPEPKPEEVEAALASAFGSMGLSESTAKLAAKGR